LITSCGAGFGGAFLVLSLSSERRGNYTVVSVSGNLDLVTHDQFDQYLTKTRRENSHIIIDMSAVTFMDTGCLAVIIGHWKRLLAGSGELILAGAQYRPAKALWITGLAYRLPLFDSVDEAIAAAPAVGEAVGPPAGEAADPAAG
jgi:anti-anti-sigma factor